MNLLLSAKRFFRHEKTDYQQVGLSRNVRELLEALGINPDLYPRAVNKDLADFIRLNKLGLMDLGFDKVIASKIKGALTKFADWFYAQSITKTDVDPLLDSPEGFWHDLKSAPRPILNRPNALDLPMAVMSENHRAVHYLIEAQCEYEAIKSLVNKHHRQGWTPLMCACVIAKETTKGANGKPERDYPIIREILFSGASITAKNDKGRTALMLAASYGHSEVVKLLLEHAPKSSYEDFANMRDYDGKTALHHAASFHQLDCMLVLLKNGANPNIPDATGMTPLMIVSGGEDEHVLDQGVRVLLAYGGDPTLKNKEGNSSLEMIKNLGYSKTERLLNEVAKKFHKK